MKIESVKLNDKKNDPCHGDKPALNRPESVDQSADTDGDKQDRPGLVEAIMGGFMNEYQNPQGDQNQSSGDDISFFIWHDVISPS
jgi:hypothetical protein